MFHFLIGFITGSFSGILTMCLCIVAGKADRNDEE